MHFKAGTPCNNYNGYCDVFQRCREVDPSGPLATLRRLLLSDESIASLKRWVVEHWYLLLFIVAAFVTVIVSTALSIPLSIYQHCTDLSPQKIDTILSANDVFDLVISIAMFLHYKLTVHLKMQ